MSARTVGALTPEPARMSSRTARSRLRVVASDGELTANRGLVRDRFGWGDELAGPGGPACGDDCVLTEPIPTIRLTRRGRVAVVVMTSLAVAVLAVVLASSVDASAPQIDHATTVSSGQTLSEVAADQLPRLPIGDAVARIQLVNGMNTSQVHAGQSLQIPVMP